MKKTIGFLSYLALLLIALPTIWVSANKSVDPQPDHSGPEHIEANLAPSP